jgi:hypothetical protein
VSSHHDDQLHAHTQLLPLLLLLLLSTCVQARLATAEQAASNARAAATEATTRASRAAERLIHTESQLEDAQVGKGRVHRELCLHGMQYCCCTDHSGWSAAHALHICCWPLCVCALCSSPISSVTCNTAA